jgi:ectoine hydroxylase-related dioxygenase (phytanoyl-CoA dioxygenase family)
VPWTPQAYLADTASDQGGFQCVPGFHRKLMEWSDQQPPDRHPKMPEDMASFKAQAIPGKAGDLVIWHSALLHGNGPN